MIFFVCYSQIRIVKPEKNRAIEAYCHIGKVNLLRNLIGKEIVYKKEIGLKCDIKNLDFTLDTNS